MPACDRGFNRDTVDFWDGNWLRVTAHCGGPGASVWTDGRIVRIDELAAWADACDTPWRTCAGKAQPKPLEPDLQVILETSDRAGHLSCTVVITSDHMLQRDKFVFALNQSFLPEIIAGLRRVLARFPVRSCP